MSRSATALLEAAGYFDEFSEDEESDYEDDWEYDDDAGYGEDDDELSDALRQLRVDADDGASHADAVDVVVSRRTLLQSSGSKAREAAAQHRQKARAERKALAAKCKEALGDELEQVVTKRIVWPTNEQAALGAPCQVELPISETVAPESSVKVLLPPLYPVQDIALISFHWSDKDSGERREWERRIPRFFSPPHSEQSSATID